MRLSAREQESPGLELNEQPNLQVESRRERDVNKKERVLDNIRLMSNDL